MKYLFFGLTIFILSSCVSHKEFLYFQQSRKTDGITQQVEKKELAVQAGDVLAISISSQIPEATSAYRLNADNMSGSPSVISDYLVDDQGYIDFPILGRLRVGGYTIDEVRELFIRRLSNDLRDPIINIRIINFTIVVLGEVRGPSTFTIQRQQLTVFEALGLAGDMTEQADRENVKIIREIDGVRTFESLDLSKASILESDYYYLKQNDVLYVPPTKRKSFTVSMQPYSQILIPILGIALSLTSFILTLRQTR